jgi:hypothetical protein
VHPLVFSWRKNSWPTSTCFEGGKQDFSSSKRDVAGILSELDIGVSKFVEELAHLLVLEPFSDLLVQLFCWAGER